MRLSGALVDSLHERLQRITNLRPPDFIIGGPEAPYLRRWWVIPRNRLFNIYLHQFLRSDDDRALHDHPWVNASLLLSGEYTEHTIAAGGVNLRQRYRTGDFRLRLARTAHRVELQSEVDGHSSRERPCWSLFITGPVIREWGFHCPAGWRPWREFVDERDVGKVGKGCA